MKIQREVLRTIAGILLVAPSAVGADSVRDRSVRVHRTLRHAEQLADSGALRRSNRLLRQLTDEDQPSAAPPVRRRAERLLAENCYASGLYQQAADLAEHRLAKPAETSHSDSVALREDRIDTHLLATEARLQLGQAAAAARHLAEAGKRFAGFALDPSVVRVEQRVRLQQVHEGLLPGQPVPSEFAGPPPAFSKFPEEHYGRAIRAWVEGLSARGRYREAADTIESLNLPETASQRLGYRQLAELHGLRMQALILAFRRDAASATEPEVEAATTTVRRVLAHWSADLRRRQRSDHKAGIANLQELASLLSLKADWCERHAASLIQQKPSDDARRRAVWTRATHVLGRLRAVASLLQGRPADWERAEASDRETVREFALQRLDRALAGYQRVLLRLRDSDAGLPASLQGLLREVSVELASLRVDRLPSGDPRVFEARLAHAFVLGSEGDHPQAIREFTRLIQLAERDSSNSFWEAQAWLGLGMSKLAEHRLDEASKALNHAQALVVDPTMRSGMLRLDQQSDAALGYLAMLQGEYRAAAERLTRIDSLPQDRTYSEEDAIRSTTKVFLALLRKSETQYDAAHEAIHQGRELAESPYVGRRHGVALDLADAALLLSEASGKSDRKAALQRADRFLDAVERNNTFSGDDRRSIGHSVTALRSQSLALQGEQEAAQRMLLGLAEGADVDPITRARAFLGLSRLVRAADPGHDDTTNLHSALSYAERAVDTLTRAEGSSSRVVYPSLTFQANSESGWLIDAIDRAGGAQVLAAKPASDAVEVAGFEIPLQPSETAIARLEAAVQVAEQPATQTTQQDLGRSRFFTRYAPAYDLLVGLHVRAAARLAAAEGKTFPVPVRSGSPAYQHLVRAMEVSDLARNRTFRESVELAAPDSYGVDRPLDQLLETLVGPDEALLVYHLGGMRWPSQRRAGGHDGEGWLFLVTDRGDSISCQPLSSEAERPLSRAEAQRVVTPYVELLSQPPEQRTPRGKVQVSHRKMAAGCTNAVLPKATQEAIANTPGLLLLKIVPDGPLHQLPFEALLRLSAKRTWEFAADWLPPITYGPSLSVLASIEQEPGRLGGWKKVVSVGAPSYDGPARDASAAGQRLLRHVGPESLAPLPNAGDEIDAVMKSFESLIDPAGLRYAKGELATEQFLRDEVAGASVLHLAAHAFASRRAEDGYAVVALTPTNPNDSENDGFLELEELAGLPLDDCELAILSACETLVGADRPLEVGMSLTRALLEQHARRVVSSHWHVDDRATAALVPAFCQRLVAGTNQPKPGDYAVALQEAKDELRSGRLEGARSEEYSDPYFWAPLILVGGR